MIERNPDRFLNRTRLKTAFVAVQALVLAGLALSYYAVGWFGQDVKLRTVPVDPRDVLYGDYVTLSYDISRLQPSLWRDQTEKAERGKAIYVVLAAGSDGYAAPAAAYGYKPSAQPGQVVLKGIIRSVWSEGISVEYGLEKYYVPEGTGKDLEKKASRLAVHLKVAPWGQGKIESLEDREQGS
ncbi:GDYXXLXY domain-containing protein [Paenibacillus filicis]|uniref:GDYXXLXY domain-containing protein n=1 Tax=Paenibacillus gyeongsangnamensis TaxID=3388067 RepID=A0ABT4QCR1_9BACL|nr:GDYXXLXY domain-containing protein [Paenibacillus filicis]MCZ8514667.1 GDYXXLXY domain-containing protein [Paenibacillus filicis]